MAVAAADNIAAAVKAVERAVVGMVERAEPMILVRQVQQAAAAAAERVLLIPMRQQVVLAGAVAVVDRQRTELMAALAGEVAALRREHLGAAVMAGAMAL